MILHSIFIFFSCLLACLLLPALSILFFLAGLFFMFVAVGVVYRMSIWRIFVFSIMPVLFVVAIVIYVGMEIPIVSVALGLLDFFYVLQSALWGFLLLPFVARQYYRFGEINYGIVFSLCLSVLVSLLSLFVVLIIVYDLVYMFFCFILL